MVMSTPPPYAVDTSQVEPVVRVTPRPRPGMSIQPSTAYAGRSPPGCTVTKPPELSETIPTSLTIATSAAASAASTALPPASATCSAASAAASFGAATARPDMPRTLPTDGPMATTVSGPTVVGGEGQERRVWKLVGYAQASRVRTSAASSAGRSSCDDHVEVRDLADATRQGMYEVLTPHQRRVAVALLVEEIPIDVLAERLATNRNALYQTLHEVRKRLRAYLCAEGYLGTDRTQEASR